jgi:hypothetical protein
MTKSDRVGAAKDITAALDRLVASLRLEQDIRLAAILYQQLHRAAWGSHSELFFEVSRLLRNAQASQISSYSVTTGAQIDRILSAIDALT